jgi:hypothetical protein
MTDYGDTLLALHEAQELILELMPENVRGILQTNMFSTFGAVYNWRRVVIPLVAELAQPDDSGRALCPLCRQKPACGFQSGFTLPTGLTRHLEGSHGFYRCQVMVVAEAVAKRTR